MRKLLLLNQFFWVFILLATVSYYGCNSKTDKADEPKDLIQNETPDTSSGTTKQEEPAEETKITVPDIKGTYSGTFDKRSTVLKITEQTDSSFSGNITINYREVINQEVKGSFSPTTMKFTMSDQLHSRYQGKYKGKFSEDMKNFSGTFTMDLDGKQFSFNLTKK